MNWHWLYEVLERLMPGSHITFANPFEPRIIAEAQGILCVAHRDRQKMIPRALCGLHEFTARDERLVVPD